MFASLVVDERLTRGGSLACAARRTPAVGWPARHVVGDDGLFAVWCVVEFATTESRVREFGREEALAVVDGLIFEEAGERL